MISDDQPCMFSHPRNLDWTARVMQLWETMSNSDAQGVADLEYRQGKLLVFPPGSVEITKAKEYTKFLQS